jgi:predicted extracellular nuclease
VKYRAYIIIVAALFFRLDSIYGQLRETARERLMFYNAENFFDAVDDSINDDEEFLPEGVKRWTVSRYKRKTEGIYKVIIAAGEWDPPDIVAFCEIENRHVLEDLVYGTGLAKYGYRIIHEDSPDRRGIDVCLIYRPDRIEIIDSHYWIPNGIKKQDYNSRSVLFCRFVVSKDTINLMMNHWPSRRGGVLAAGKLRNKIAAMVMEKADSIYNSNIKSKIIIAGDFNSNPGEMVMKLLSGRDHQACTLVNLSDNPSLKPGGTYKYRGIWEMIDQVLVSVSILHCKEGIYADSSSLRIFNPQFLLVADDRYTGVKPFSTYSGYIYKGGFSDHLPVLLDLKVRNKN